jgi:hypothetical protein
MLGGKCYLVGRLVFLLLGIFSLFLLSLPFTIAISHQSLCRTVFINTSSCLTLQFRTVHFKTSSCTTMYELLDSELSDFELMDFELTDFASLDTELSDYEWSD